MDVLPVVPSTVAVIAVEPGLTPETIPLVAFTFAMAVFELLQETDRPVITLPAESRGVAVAVVVLPAVMVDEPRLTTTVATVAVGGAGRVTVTSAWPALPSRLAVIVALPAETPCTTPIFASTVATVASEVLHANGRFVSVFPTLSCNTADACALPPTAIWEGSMVTTISETLSIGVAVSIAPLQAKSAAMMVQTSALDARRLTLKGVERIVLMTGARLGAPTQGERWLQRCAPESRRVRAVSCLDRLW